MSLLFIDGFDHYATADILGKWTAKNGANGTISAGVGRRGGSALSSGSAGHVTKAVTPGASFVLGMAVSMTGPTSPSATIASFLDAGTTQCDLRINADGTISVTRNGTAVTGGTSTYVLPSGAYSYLEWKLTIADSISAGSCKVRVNGVDVLTVATGQDMKNTVNASANQVRIGNHTTSWLSGLLIDDFYICDQIGSAPLNDFLGDSRVDLLPPTSDGAYSQFTPSTGTSHFALVDEATPNITDYNDGATIGDRDSYGVGNLSALASQIVYGVQVNAAVLKDDAGAKSAAVMVRSGTTNADGTSTPLGTIQSYISQVFELNPSGSVAWTETTVNAMEAGVLVTA